MIYGFDIAIFLGDFQNCAKVELSLDLVNVSQESVIIADISNPEDVDQDLVIPAIKIKEDKQTRSI